VTSKRFTGFVLLVFLGLFGRCAVVSAREAYVDSSVHYDQVFRWRAMAAHAEGNIASAIEGFERAARYADKPSQFALGVIHLNGEGVPRDRALAWAWFDVAAERGYRELVEQRHSLWEQLTDGERAAARALSKELHAKFGDAKAKVRHRRKTLAALQHSLGKSKSVRDNVMVTDMQNCSAGLVDFSRGNVCSERGEEFFESRFDPSSYWAAQDAAWGVGGMVEIGPLLRPKQG